MGRPLRYSREITRRWETRVINTGAKLPIDHSVYRLSEFKFTEDQLGTDPPGSWSPSAPLSPLDVSNDRLDL